MTPECDEKFEEKIDLGFRKWHEKLGKFSPEYMKVSKLELSLGSFIQSRKCMSLKLTGELSAMTIKNDTKGKMELTCQFKIDMMNLTILTRALKNLKNLHFNGLLLTKVYNVWA